MGGQRVGRRHAVTVLVGLLAVACGADPGIPATWDISVAAVAGPLDVRDGFVISGGGFLGPDGQPFVPRGLTAFAGWTLGDGFASDLVGPGRLAEVTGRGINVLRVITCPDTTCDHHQGATVAGDDLHEVVETYTAAGVVILLSNYGAPLGRWAGPGNRHIAFAKTWFAELAERYADNPFVWFQPFNEPMNEGRCRTDKVWTTLHEPVVAAIRATGAPNVIVLNGNHFGQDGGTNCDHDASAILNQGPPLVERYGNVAFDVHWYDRWREASPDAIAGYFDAARERGLTVLVGEVGGDPAGIPRARHDFEAAVRFFDAAPRSVGVVVWGGPYEAPTLAMLDAWIATD